MRLPEDTEWLWSADEAIGQGEPSSWEECLDPRGAVYYAHR